MRYLDALCTSISGRRKIGDVFAVRGFTFNVNNSFLKDLIDGKKDDSEDDEIDPRDYLDIHYVEHPNWLLNLVVSRGEVDWDRVLRYGNEYCDRYQQISRLSLYTEHQPRYTALEEEIKRMSPSIRTIKCDTEKKDGHIVNRPRLDTTTAVFILTWNRCQETPCLYPPVLSRISLRQQFAPIANALSAYRTDCNSYPTMLDELQPKYFAKLPKDPYGKGTFRYHRTNDGYVIYSVGPNGKDEDGYGPMSRIRASYLEKGDDYGIQVGNKCDEKDY